MEWVIVIGFILLLVGAASALAGGIGTGFAFVLLGTAIVLSGFTRMNDENHKELVNQAASQQNIAVLEINGDNLTVATNKTGQCFMKAKMTAGRIVTTTSDDSSQLINPEVISRSCK